MKTLVKLFLRAAWIAALVVSPLSLLASGGGSTSYAWVLGVPATAKTGTAIFPIAKGAPVSNHTIDLVELAYQWDSTAGTWTTLVSNSSPAAIDHEGYPFYIPTDKAGHTCYFRAYVHDNFTNGTYDYDSVSISASDAYSSSLLSSAELKFSQNYGATMMHDSSTGTFKLWWTGLRGVNLGGDALWYLSNVGSGTAPSSPFLDETTYTAANGSAPHLLSDPCVIKPNNGSGTAVTFHVGSEYYEYAMYNIESDSPYLTGSPQYVLVPNRIGLLFSHNGTSWTDRRQIITTVNQTGGNFGIAFPSVTYIPTLPTGTSGSSHFCMFNTDGNVLNPHVYFRRSSDGITWLNNLASSDSDVSNSGYAKDISLPTTYTILHPKFAYDSGYWYLTFSTDVGSGKYDTIVVYRAAADSNLLPGSWSLKKTIAASEASDERKQDPSFARDENGFVYGGESGMQIIYDTYTTDQDPNGPLFAGDQLYYATPKTVP